jgi:membrane protease YdiL (CAAX protease family)
MKDKKLTIALTAIIIYVVLSSISMNAGYIWQALAAVVMSIALLAYLAASRQFKEIGFRKLTRQEAARALFFLPMAILLTANLWNGLEQNLEGSKTACLVVSMLCSGLLEEVIFRGLLFNAISQASTRQALVITSITFGLGHIVNLLNGADLIPTLLQLVYAIAIGFMLGSLVLKTGSIIPGIAFHSLFNIASVFSNEAGLTRGVEILIAASVTIISLGYAVYILKASFKARA